MTMLEQLPMLNTMSPEYQADWHGLNRAALAQSPVAQGIFGPVLLGYREVQGAIRDRSFRNPPAKRSLPNPASPRNPRCRTTRR